MKSYRALRETGQHHHRLLGDSLFREEHRQLVRGQWDDPATVTARQTGMLARLLAHATRRVPHYRDALPDSSELEQDPRRWLAAFPILTRTVLQGSLPSLIAKDWPLADLGLGHTSGSTGRPVSFYRTRRSLVGADVGRHWAESMSGYRAGMKRAVLWGSERDLQKRSSAPGWWKRRVQGRHTFNTFRMPVARMENMVRELRRHRTEYLYGYASSVYHFARFCRRTGVSFSFTGVQTTADSLLPTMSGTITQALGTEPSDRYSSREVGVIAAGCPEQGGLHVAADQKVVEVVREDGSPAGPGETGRILITDLLNFGMPIIRYELGDLGIPGADCSCGRGYPVLQRVVGREGDSIVSPGGKRLDPELFARLFSRYEEIEQFQVVQVSTDELEILVAAAPGFSLDLEEVRRGILAEGDPGFRIEFRRVGEIQPATSGRFSCTSNRARSA